MGVGGREGRREGGRVVYIGVGESGGGVILYLK